MLSCFQKHWVVLERRTSGHRFGIRCCAWSSGIVLLLNIGILFYTSVYFGITDGIGTLYDGSCKHSSSLGIWSGVLINVLGSVLLGASNYSMQCLSSPTRCEIDDAHSKGTWLDIGLPSVRNIWSIALHRRYLWWALAFSTIPLHLLWSSAIFTSFSSQNYTSWVVPSDFALFNVSITRNVTEPGFYVPFQVMPNDTCLGNGGDRSHSPWDSPGSRYWSTWLGPDYHRRFPWRWGYAQTQLYNVSNGLSKNKSSDRTTSEMVDMLCQKTFVEGTEQKILAVGGDAFSYSYFRDWYPTVNDPSLVQVIANLQSDPGAFDHLSKADCVKTYLSPVLAGHKHVLLISSVPSTNFSFWQQHSGSRQSFVTWFGDITSATCDYSPAGVRGPFTCLRGYNGHRYSDPFFDDFEIQSCVSEQTEEHCKLQMSLPIMIVVIACNCVKLGCFVSMTRRQDSETLVTIGDAISSFLQRKDDTTLNACLADSGSFAGSETANVQELHWPGEGWRLKMASTTCKPDGPIRLITISPGRWILCSGLWILTLAMVSMLLSMGLNNDRLPGRSLVDLYNLGFGTVTPQAVLTQKSYSGSWGLVLTALVSNSPQLIVSFLYLAYNSLITSMHITKEWNSYATQRKPLRVTSPRGKQRSTYWLELPYRYSLFLIFASIVLRWLLSQSIFLARVTVLGPDGVEDMGASLSTCGYSNIALICVLGFGSLQILIAVILGVRRVMIRMPIAGSCSAAISAACHAPEMDPDAAFKSVKWGAVKLHELTAIEDGKSNTQHCCFTSLEVTKPSEGVVYI